MTTSHCWHRLCRNCGAQITVRLFHDVTGEPVESPAPTASSEQHRKIPSCPVCEEDWGPWTAGEPPAEVVVDDDDLPVDDAAPDAAAPDWPAYEKRELAARRCPHSGEPLTRDGDGGPEALSCILCDCFGYAPDDPRIGA